MINWDKMLEHRNKIEDILAEIWQDRQTEISTYELSKKLSRIKRHVEMMGDKTN